MQSAEDYKRVSDIDNAFVEKEKQWIITAVNQMMNYLGVGAFRLCYRSGMPS